jgi:hypothetical protein
VTEPDQVASLEERSTPHPRRTFADPTRLTGAVDAIPGRAVLCVPARMPFGELARGLGYKTVELESAHDAMVTAPDALAGLLQEDA